MANHGQMIARLDRSMEGILKADLVCNRAHIEVVSHDQASETEVGYQQFGDNGT